MTQNGVVTAEGQLADWVPLSVLAWFVPRDAVQARQRLGPEPMRRLFGEVAVPVAEEDTPGAFLGPGRLMAIDGFEWDAPDTEHNAAEFGYAGKDPATRNGQRSPRPAWSPSASAVRTP